VKCTKNLAKMVVTISLVKHSVRVNSKHLALRGLIMKDKRAYLFAKSLH
jgi:hypothetical protein